MGLRHVVAVLLTVVSAARTPTATGSPKRATVARTVGVVAGVVGMALLTFPIVTASVSHGALTARPAAGYFRYVARTTWVEQTAASPAINGVTQSRVTPLIAGEAAVCSTQVVQTAASPA